MSFYGNCSHEVPRASGHFMLRVLDVCVYYTIRLNCMKRAVFGGQKPSDMVQLSTFNYRQTFLLYLSYLFLWQTLGLQSWPDRRVFTTFLWDRLLRVAKWDTQDWMKIPLSLDVAPSSALGTGIPLNLKVLMGLLSNSHPPFLCPQNKTREWEGKGRRTQRGNVLGRCSSSWVFNSISQNWKNRIERIGTHCTTVMANSIPWNSVLCVCVVCTGL